MILFPYFYSFWRAFCATGFNHSVKTKEYGEMLNPERQDETKQGASIGVDGLAETLPHKFSM